jgi:hypothetical protein
MTQQRLATMPEIVVMMQQEQQQHEKQLAQQPTTVRITVVSITMLFND